MVAISCERIRSLISEKWSMILSPYRTLFSLQKAAGIFWSLTALSVMSAFGITDAGATSSSRFFAAVTSKPMTKKAPHPSKPSAQKKDKSKSQEQAKSQAPKKPSGPTILAKEGLWTVYSAQQEGKRKLCYAMTRPTQRLPKTLAASNAHLFVSTRPNEGVRNEVNITLGTPLKEEDPKAQITIGSHVFPLTLKESYGWIKNVNEEKNAVVAMQKNKEVIVKVQSRKGTTITDHYSLKGLSQALARVQKECP